VLVFTLSGCAAGTSPRGATLDDATGATLALVHVRVVDAGGAPPRDDQTVLMRGRHIVAVGPTHTTRVPAGARVLDGAGKVVIPGLWDMHVHVFDQPAFLPALLASGVTGVRDMGDVSAPLARWRDSVRTGAWPGPRVVFPGAILDRTAQPGALPFWIAVDDSVRAHAVVDSLADLGADFVKVYQSLRAPVYRAVVDAARRRRLPVAGHVPDAVPLLDAVRAGQRSTEHLTGVLLAASRDGERLRRAVVDSMEARRDASTVFRVGDAQLATRVAGYDPERARVLYAALSRAETWVVPTLVVHQAGWRLDDARFTRDERLRYLPAYVRAAFTDVSRAEAARRTTAVAERERFRLELRVVGDMHRAGVRLLAGTDAPNPFLTPGLYLVDELAYLVEAGLTPLEALRAATLEPARYLGATDSLGTVAAGKLADLVVLDADPLTDIRNTARVHAVVMNGRLIDAAARRQLLLDAASAADGVRGAAPARR
jgi:imidazolonepropionase-like amidohydrolase